MAQYLPQQFLTYDQIKEIVKKSYYKYNKSESDKYIQIYTRPDISGGSMKINNIRFKHVTDIVFDSDEINIDVGCGNDITIDVDFMTKLTTAYEFIIYPPYEDGSPPAFPALSEALRKGLI